MKTTYYLTKFSVSVGAVTEVTASRVYQMARRKGKPITLAAKIASLKKQVRKLEALNIQ